MVSLALSCFLALGGLGQQGGPGGPGLRRAPLSIEVLGPGWAAPVLLEDGGRHAGLWVAEPDQGQQDLNGDGDALDVVLHVVDRDSGSTTNLGQAVGLSPGAPAPPRDGRFAFRIGEEENGGQDLNGDGDTADALASVYDVQSGTLHVSAFSGAVHLAERPWAAIAVDEEQHGDLNANGSAQEEVVHVWNVETGAVVNLGLPLGTFRSGVTRAQPDRTIRANGSSLLFPVGESAAGIDLNGDGDATDHVLHVHDAALGQTVNTGLALTLPPFVSNGLEVLVVDESAQSEDLNGDGDTHDEVPLLFHKPTSTVRVLPWAVEEDFEGNGHAPPTIVGTLVAARGDRIAFSVGERAQGGQDLSGDGDAEDHVLFLHELSSNQTRMVGAAFGFELNDDHLVFLASESGSGTSLNGDGDEVDFVPHVYEIASRTTTNVGVASDRKAGISLADGRFAFLEESLHELHHYEIVPGVLTATGLVAEDEPSRWSGRLLVFLARGAGFPVVSLLNAVDTRSGRHLSSPLEVQHDGLSLSPPYRRSFWIRTDERVRGRDLNGDGDAADASVWRLVRVAPHPTPEVR